MQENGLSYTFDTNTLSHGHLTASDCQICSQRKRNFTLIHPQWQVKVCPACIKKAVSAKRVAPNSLAESVQNFEKHIWSADLLVPVAFYDYAYAYVELVLACSNWGTGVLKQQADKILNYGSQEYQVGYVGIKNALLNADLERLVVDSGDKELMKFLSKVSLLDRLYKVLKGKGVARHTAGNIRQASLKATVNKALQLITDYVSRLKHGETPIVYCKCCKTRTSGELKTEKGIVRYCTIYTCKAFRNNWGIVLDQSGSAHYQDVPEVKQVLANKHKQVKEYFSNR